MDNEIDIMTALRRKVLQLVDLYESEKKTTSRLSGEIEILRKQLQDRELEIDALKNNNSQLKLAVAFKSVGGVKNARKMIGDLVQEIDECVALLNK